MQSTNWLGLRHLHNFQTRTLTPDLFPDVRITLEAERYKGSRMVQGREVTY